jgi:maltose-6'-phosphate glucosidase
MRSYAKILGVEQKNLRATYFGLNHFGWFTELKDVDGNDYFDKLRTYLRDYDFKPYNAEQRSKSWLDTYLRVNKYMNFFDEYIPTTYLQYYFFAEEIVAESDPNYTRADEAKDSREKEVWDICSKATNANSIDDVEIITNSVFGDLMIELAESIAYDLHNEFILMSRNNDIITNFSKDAIVEVSGTVGKDGAHPYKYGEIKPFYKGLMEGQHAYELLTVEAFLEKNYTKALQALTLNRTIVNPEKAKAVLDDLMEKNKDFWYLT